MYVRTYLPGQIAYVRSYSTNVYSQSQWTSHIWRTWQPFIHKTLHLTHLCMYVTWFSDGLQTNCKTCVRSFFLHTYTHTTYIYLCTVYLIFPPPLCTYVPSGQECCLLCPPDLCSLSTLQSVSERSKAPGVLEREESSTTERSASSGTTKSCGLSGGS